MTRHSFLCLCSTTCATYFIAMGSLFAQTDVQTKSIVAKYNVAAIKAFSDQLMVNRSAQLQEAKDAGFRVTFEINNDDGTGVFAALQAVTSDGKPVYYRTLNASAARATRTNYLHPGGLLGLDLAGEDMTVFVWDGGATRTTHVEFTGRVSIGDINGGYNGLGSDHATHVTGTLVAAGVDPLAKGMAFKAHAKTYNWDFDSSEVAVEAAGGMLVSNHSYGFAVRDDQGAPALPASYFGGYLSMSREWDSIMHMAPNYLMVVAAGNDGQDNTANSTPNLGAQSFDKLTGHCVSKNGLVVANARDVNVSSSGEPLGTITIVPSSSQGPTDDLRVKPDITGNGEELKSTLHLGNNGTTNNKYGQQNWTGTSMASPNVAGSLLLLQELKLKKSGRVMRAATLKGLVLHTADDAGSDGPDPIFGWGLLNAKRAAETVQDIGTKAAIAESRLANATPFSFKFKSKGQVMVSLCWTDLPGVAVSDQTVNSTTAVLVNDLDLRVKRNGEELLPWRLTSLTANSRGDNRVDPYERIDDPATFDSPVEYEVIISHKGQLVGGGQDYSLIVTGDSSQFLANAVADANTDTGSQVVSLRSELQSTIDKLTRILEQLPEEPLNPSQTSHLDAERPLTSDAEAVIKLLEEKGAVGVLNLIRANNATTPLSAEERKQLNAILTRLSMPTLDVEASPIKPSYGIKPGIGTPEANE